MSFSKKIIGFTDSVNECDCCGKSGLKGTFCVEINGKELYYGSTCAFKKHGFDQKEILNQLKSFDSKIQWAGSLSIKKFRLHNEDSKTFEEILKIIKPLVFSDDKKAIKNLIPSLPWNL